MELTFPAFGPRFDSFAAKLGLSAPGAEMVPARMEKTMVPSFSSDKPGVGGARVSPCHQLSRGLLDSRGCQT